MAQSMASTPAAEPSLSLPAERSLWPSPAALEEACRRAGKHPIVMTAVEPPGHWQAATVITLGCSESPSCPFRVRAQRTYTAAGVAWRVSDVAATHAHAAPPMSAAPSVSHGSVSSALLPSRSASLTTKPAAPSRFPMAPPRSLSFSASRSRPAPAAVSTIRPNQAPFVPEERNNRVLMPMSPSQPLVGSPSADKEEAQKAAPRSPSGCDSPVAIPPVPHIGSLWASREQFKEACVKHGAASRPRFGFATSGSNNSGRKPFLCFGCRHAKRRDGCPYFLRLEVADPDDPSSKWIVRHACYEHARHSVPSPPLRKGAWSRIGLPPVKRKRQSHQRAAPTDNSGTSGIRTGDESPLTSSELSDASDEDSDQPSEHPPAKRSYTPAKRSESSVRAALSTLSDSAAARKASTSSKMASVSQRSLPDFLEQLHPLWDESAANAAAAQLRQAGVDDTAVLCSLSPNEVVAVLQDMDAGQPGSAYTPAQFAVLRHRLAVHLSDDPAGLLLPRPGRRPSTLVGTLCAIHSTLFPRDKAAVEVASVLERVGVTSAEALKSLTQDELTEILSTGQAEDEPAALSTVQRVVIASRARHL